MAAAEGRREIERLYPICPAIAAAPAPRADCVQLRFRTGARGQPGKPRGGGERAWETQGETGGDGRGGRGREGKGLGDRHAQGDMHNLVFFISFLDFFFSRWGEGSGWTVGDISCEMRKNVVDMGYYPNKTKRSTVRKGRKKREQRGDIDPTPKTRAEHDTARLNQEKIHDSDVHRSRSASTSTRCAAGSRELTGMH